MMNYPVKHNISLAILLFCLWLGLSGQLNVLMLSLGLASTLLVVYFSHRMDTIDREKYPAHLTPLLLRFWLFLTREVIAANIDVVKRIFKPGKNISPQLFQLPMTKKTDLARVIYANAITMTPGTVCVKVNRETITVHSLSKESADDLRSGRMAEAVPEDYRDEES
ncbi:Na+/H+ antiporter subunit E [bacterium]|jgi:multicomponent Na+:H+ antiporter subunit E|nr:Na+/H+ antiporter subunit E [bacterium]